MSPLWRDEVVLQLGPRLVSLARRRRGLKPQVILENSIALTDLSRPGDWLPALSAARQELERPEWRNANARIVVADHWVRYAVVPWRRELTSDEERLAHGRLILRQIYGDEMSGWSVQLGRTAPECAQLVCAIPSALLSDVNVALQQSELRLLSLSPNLVVAFNRWRHRIPESDCWFVAVDDGCLAAARLAGGTWADVHCIRAGGDWVADLNRLRTLERLANGGQSPRSRALVDAPARLRSVEAAVRHGLEWLDPEAAQDTTLSRLGRLRGINP